MSVEVDDNGPEKRRLKVPKMKPPDMAAASNKKELKPPWPKDDGKAVGEYQPRCLDPALFPDRPKPGRSPPTTIRNLGYLLEQHGITVRYNVVKKEIDITIPGVSLTVENSDNAALAHVVSLVALNSMNTGLVPFFLVAIGDAHAFNPVAEWIRSRPWDGSDRLPAFYGTLRTKAGYPVGLKKVLMRKWLLSAVAAALSVRGFKCRGVLTLQGPQGIGKTSWGRNLIDDPILRDAVIKTDHHLDGGNKDSLITAISHFIVEIGELESSFKRDVSRLKGFLTADSDKVRKPYLRGDSDYPRRTVFYATVNQTDFLVDTTGNSRWWTIAVDEIDYNHTIDMQQLFAQLATEFEKGEQWWLTSEEDAELSELDGGHQSVSVIREEILDYIDLKLKDEPGLDAMTPTQLLKVLDIKPGTNAQAKECGAVLRQLLGDPKRINGRDKWRIPVKHQYRSNFPSKFTEPDMGDYD